MSKSDNAILCSDLKHAWKYAVRALCAAESAELHDTCSALMQIVAALSQQLEYHDVFDEIPGFTMKNN